MMHNITNIRFANDNPMLHLEISLRSRDHMAASERKVRGNLAHVLPPHGVSKLARAWLHEDVPGFDVADTIFDIGVSVCLSVCLSRA